MTVVNMLLTLALAGVIGWQAKVKAFPFNGFANGFRWADVGAVGVMNCLFVAYDACIILATWFSLGLLTIQAVIYMLLVAGAFALGWNHVWFRYFIEDCKRHGIMKALKDDWRSFGKWN